MSARSTSGLSVGLLLRVIDVKYGCLLLLTYGRRKVSLPENNRGRRTLHKEGSTDIKIVEVGAVF